MDLIIIARNNLEDDSQDVRDVLVVDIRVDHFDVQVHPVYLVVMLVHLTLVIAKMAILLWFLCSEDEFYFRWLENSVIGIGKAA